MFQEKLLKWYFDNHRDLPWRQDHDPYKIWLSEIMLQQTQVKTVIQYFKNFIKAYPNVTAMANADEQDVLKLWEGLGYYSRARRLIPCAKMVVEEFDGIFPTNKKDMLKLPGVGSYTAGAILSIAYNVKEPAVDGNVMRVYSRLFDMEDDISLPKTKTVFENKVMATLPEDRRHFNQALMELGATICTPKQSKCDVCPIAASCQALKNNTVEIRPVKTKKIKKKTKDMVVCFVKHQDKVMIVKRPDDGLLAGLWAFPIYPLSDSLESSVEYGLNDEFDAKVKQVSTLKNAKHVFTHLVWKMTVVEVVIEEKVDVFYPEMKWIDWSSIEDYPLPTAFKKLI